jgi:hypothetical protein
LRRSVECPCAHDLPSRSIGDAGRILCAERPPLHFRHGLLHCLRLFRHGSICQGVDGRCSATPLTPVPASTANAHRAPRSAVCGTRPSADEQRHCSGLIGAVCELDQDFSEGTGAGGHMLRTCFLLFAVTDAIAAGNEDHTGGTPPCHEFCVMRGTRGDVRAWQAQPSAAATTDETIAALNVAGSEPMLSGL